MSKALAIKYRPKDWEEVMEQTATAVILQNQIQTKNIRNAYLFCGPAGCGKTTIARIFANNLNDWEGTPIEMDAASNNSVDNVREIEAMAQTRSVDGEYKIFILDECHMLSNSAWNAMLKLIEEPPAKSIFIFCTTDPQKIPKTILSRTQRYDFQRISLQGIVDRLQYILDDEHLASYHIDAIEYIAKIAEGGMRDAITLLDKSLAFSTELTVENVIKALGKTDINDFMALSDALFDGDKAFIIKKIDALYSSGIELKQFVKDFMNFILDVLKYQITDDMSYTQLPEIEEVTKWLKAVADVEVDRLLDLLIDIDNEIKWSQHPKYVIEAKLLTF